MKPVNSLLYLTTAWAFGTAVSNIMGWATISWFYVFLPLGVALVLIFIFAMIYEIAFRASAAAIAQYMLARDLMISRMMTQGTEEEEEEEKKTKLTVIDGGKEE